MYPLDLLMEGNKRFIDHHCNAKHDIHVNVQSSPILRMLMQSDSA